jgi:hypothetical protein
MTGLNSINSICFCLKAHKKNLYHLGIKQFVNVSTLSQAGESRDWHIFSDFGNYLIKIARPLYINLTWVQGKYSRGAVKMHTLIDLRGSIPTLIHITDGKYHDSTALDVIDFLSNAIYLMDKAYVDFEALCRMQNIGAFFVTRTKGTMRYEVIEQNLQYNLFSNC